MIKKFFINKFQTGSTENPNIGMGTIVGFDTYTKKGVALLAKKSTYSSGALSATPHFLETSQLGTSLWAQLSDGSVYYSNDAGVNWSDTSFPAVIAPEVKNGNGLIYFQGYVFAFTNNSIYYHDSNPATGSWTLWKTGLTTPSTSPINSVHTPFLFASNRGFYFCNGTSVGYVAQNGTTTFNPAGVSGTDYLYNATILTLPALTYATNVLNFLPPTNLAVAAYAINTPEASDLITWDTVTQNKFSPPLRFFSNSITENSVTGGIKQLFNRNQVLYAVVGGNHTVYETNASTYSLLADISLYSSVRQSTGKENTMPVYFNPYPQGIAVFGNKLLTAVATYDNTSSYPAAGYGIFPIGIWSIAFGKGEDVSVQCEYVLPIDNAITSPASSGNLAKITCIKAIGNGKIAFGFTRKNITQVYGVAIVDAFNYIASVEQTSLESELFQIGTALNPQQVSLIEIQFAKLLLSDQTFDVSYRTSLDQDWTLMPYDDSGTTTFTGDGTKNYYQIQKNAIGPTQFVQFRFRMATGATNPQDSPQLRSITIS